MPRINKNPFLNALVAAVYIVVIVFIMDTVTRAIGPQGTILVPMAVLSLFVLSAAIMGFLFIYEPFRLYFDNQKKEAITFFAKTVGAFACFAVLFLVVLLFTSLLP